MFNKHVICLVYFYFSAYICFSFVSVQVLFFLTVCTYTYVHLDLKKGLYLPIALYLKVSLLTFQFTTFEHISIEPFS